MSQALVWVGLISDSSELPYVYVAVDERALLQDMRENYAEIAPREVESTEEWFDRLRDHGISVTTDSYYVEGSDGAL